MTYQVPALSFADASYFHNGHLVSLPSKLVKPSHLSDFEYAASTFRNTLEHIAPMRDLYIEIKRADTRSTHTCCFSKTINTYHIEIIHISTTQLPEEMADEPTFTRVADQFFKFIPQNATLILRFQPYLNDLLTE